MAETLSYKDLITKQKNESSQTIRERVMNVHKIQLERYKNEQFNYNSQIPSNKIERYCFLDNELKEYMEENNNDK